MLNDSAKELAELTVLIMDEGLLESGRAAPVTLCLGENRGGASPGARSAPDWRGEYAWGARAR
jgi:hypothetical protein